MFRFSRLHRRIVETLQREQFSISKLSNGLRVITCDDQTGAMGIGLFSLNGAKFEEEGNFGSAAIGESLFLQSNDLLTSAEMSESIGVLGNAIRLTSNKEASGVLMLVGGYHCKEALHLLNAIALHPSRDANEFELAKMKVLERSRLARRDGMSMCLEMLHDAGWSGKGLGHPSNPQEEELNALTVEQFSRFFHRHTTPSRSVVSATGVMNHFTFVQQVEECLKFDAESSSTEGEGSTFASKEKDARIGNAGEPVYPTNSSPLGTGRSSSCTTSSPSSGRGTSGMESTNASGVSSLQASTGTSSSSTCISSYPYTGGVRTMENTSAPESLSKFQEKNLSHLALFFQAVPLSHPDYFTVSVMQTLLGGGTSFSSGGPGKGMHTKLYREVLTKEARIHGLECITAWYSDGGLLGFYGACEHEAVERLLQVMKFQALTIADRISERDLQMAKNQMLSQLVMLGESREQLLSDMGLNLLIHDYTITPKATAEGARHVTMDGLRRVSQALVRSPPSLAVYGATASVPSFEGLKKYFQSKSGNK